MTVFFISLGLFVLALLAYCLLRRNKEFAWFGLLAGFSVILSFTVEQTLEWREGYTVKSLFFVLLALLIWFLITRLLSPDRVIKASIPLYALTMVFLAVCMFLPSYGYYVWFGNVVIEPSKLLMFTVLPVAYLISKQQTIRLGTVLLVSLMLLLELGLAVQISNYRVVFIVFFVFLALLYKAKAEKRLHISWAYPITLSALFVGVYGALLLFSPRMHDRLLMFLSGGNSDPTGSGYFLRLVRAGLGESRLIGSCDPTFNGLSVKESLTQSGYYPLISGILEYGWIFFLLILVAEVLLVFRLFRMSKKVKNTYARYVIFSIGAYFALTTVFSLMGEFSGLGASVSLPFLGRGSSMIIEGVLLAVASLFYSKRKKITYGAQLDVDYDFTGGAMDYFIEKYREILSSPTDPETESVFRSRLAKLESDRERVSEDQPVPDAVEDFADYYRDTVVRSDDPKRVFISYNTGDGMVVRYLAQELKKRGLNPWYCEADVKEYKGSCAYSEAIMEGLGDTKVFVVVLTPRSAVSKHVLSEVAIAFEDELPIVPIRIEDFKLDGPMRYYTVLMDIRDAIPPETKRKLREIADIIAGKCR